MEPITILTSDIAVKLTVEQAQSLGIDITKDEIPANYEAFGPQGIIKSFEAICISVKWEKKRFFSERISTTFYGKRKLSNPRQSDYCLEGYVLIGGKRYSAFTSDKLTEYVSIGGKMYPAFTSDQLIEVEGKLINVQTIHARVK